MRLFTYRPEITKPQSHCPGVVGQIIHTGSGFATRWSAHVVWFTPGDRLAPSGQIFTGASESFTTHLGHLDAWEVVLEHMGVLVPGKHLELYILTALFQTAEERAFKQALGRACLFEGIATQLPQQLNLQKS